MRQPSHLSLMATTRYFLEITYQGTHYHGWQIQPNAQTVQGVIQDCLRTLLRQDIKIVGSGRTDTGVHAQQQWAHADLPTGLDMAQLHYRLNSLLPPDIAIVAIHPVQPTAHARFSALSRTYRYTITLRKDPFQTTTSYWYRGALDLHKMNQAAALLCATRDFEHFSKRHAEVQNFVCHVMQAHWTATADQFIFHIQANRFLRGMVRIIAGHLLQVGTGKRTLSAFEALVNQPTEDMVNSLVPAKGLNLLAVNYPATIFLS